MNTEHDEADDWCDVPPFGWRCTRPKGHDGSCAAYECPDDVEFVARAMDRLREEKELRTPLALPETMVHTVGTPTGERHDLPPATG